MIRAARLQILIELLAFTTVFGACATGNISSAPFEQMSSSMLQVRTGADASLGVLYDRARDRYIATATADVDQVEALKLTRPKPGDTFGWTSSKTPLFLTTARFREGVYRLNSTIIEYSNTLGRLANQDLIDPAAFNQLAKDLNGNLNSAVTALGVQPSGREIAIFSTVASAAFEAYLRHQQRSALVKALRENQPAIQNVGELGAQAVRITAEALRSEYDLRSRDLAVAAAPPGTPASRQAAVRELADFDDRFVKELSALKVLHDTYVALPAAHQEVATSLEQSRLGLASLQALFQNGQDLFRRYEELAGKDKKTK
jgi:hypothetical protein